MRNVYLLLNIVLFTAAALLTALNLRWHPQHEDPAIKWVVPAGEPLMGTPSEQETQTPKLSVIRDQNLFSPSRGAQLSEQSSHSDDKTKPPRFELVGICAIGENSGAIIETKNGSGAESPAGKRNYFAIGSEVGNGFILESVGDNSAVLVRNQEKLELKISRTRFSAEVKKGAGKVVSPPNQNRQLHPVVARPRPHTPVVVPSGGVNPQNTQNKHGR